MKNTVENALRSQNLRYQVLTDTPVQTVLRMGMGMENGRFDVFIDVRPEHQQTLIFTVFPSIVPESQRLRVSEFITRANYGLVVGNFEMDMGDGELRYKVTYFYDNMFPNSETVFLKSLFTSFHMMNRYLPGIMAVIYANVLPQVAVNQIENLGNPMMN
ncbi:MAG: YbjN domain-containing protein [Saprospiraceae bacterium]|nr:YbjN domain-containing protein [Saprospiraceae bacterium]MDW8229221.1 YbjN domain-containing protein [Saprospiraceae bacterium]